MRFTERTQIERGFGAVFAVRIAPRIEGLETARHKLLRRTALICGAIVGGGLLLALGAFSIIGTSSDVALFALFGSGFIAFWVFKSFNQDWQQELSDVVMPAVCDHVGDIAYRTDHPMYRRLGAFERFAVVKPHKTADLTHSFSGTYRGVAFALTQAALTGARGDEDAVIFEGLLFEIDVPKPAPCDIRISPVGKTLFGKAYQFAADVGSNLQQVQTGHDAFEAEFDLLATDPDAARAYLPLPFFDAILDITAREFATPGKVRAAFEGGQFYLALGRQDKFMEHHDLTHSIDELESELHLIFDDITIGHRIIDRLAGDAA